MAGARGAARQAADRRARHWSWVLRKAWHRSAGALVRFRFEGRRYRYFVSAYNSTFENERCVEIPIVWTHLRGRPGARVLEVGNVLSHYFDFPHTVVDKYEVAPGVINRDVLDIGKSLGRFDQIVSISTLEHVGWDEPAHDPSLSARAIGLLAGLLEPGGELTATLPLHHNPGVDAWLAEPGDPRPSVGFLRRTGDGPRWAECTREEAEASPRRGTGSPITAVAVVRIRAP